jgi:ribosomal protein L40E
MSTKRTLNKIEKIKRKNSKKICSNCGAESESLATKCESCGKTHFEPEWVKALRPINRQFSVQITAPNPRYGREENRITLSKWWPGDHGTIHIPNYSQWSKISNIINEELGPKLGWSTVGLTGINKSNNAPLENPISDMEDFIRDLVSNVDVDKLSKQDFDSFIDTLGKVADVFTNANAGFREVFLEIVKKLPAQKQRALEDLNLLLRGWSLQVITNVSQQVKSRLDTIATFEEQINDPRVFEIRGEDSIHRVLEKAMWLIDEHYWLLHSNQPLRVFIGDEMAKRDKAKYGKKRPDFVCGTVGDRLIILELKRPGKALSVKDLNQLETYLAVAESYFDLKNYRSGRGYLVGSKLGDDLKRHLKYRSSLEVLLYANILDETKKRYDEFLKTLTVN